MKSFFVVLGLLCYSAPLFAQAVKVEVIGKKKQYIPGESLIVGVRISNSSGQTLHFGKDDYWVRFDIEAYDGNVVRESRMLEAKGEFEVEVATRVTRRFDLAKSFELDRSGRFVITATLHIREPNWRTDLVSNGYEVDLIRGLTLWEQVYGLPQPAGTTGEPIMRKFALQKANFFNNKMKLYMVLTDGTGGKVFKVESIDEMVSFGKPQALIDQTGSLHVLHRTPREIARSFTYAVFSPIGDITKRQTYDSSLSRPRLIGKDGEVRVSGGVRVVKPWDIPKVEAQTAAALPESSLPDIPEVPATAAP